MTRDGDLAPGPAPLGRGEQRVVVDGALLDVEGERAVGGIRRPSSRQSGSVMSRVPTHTSTGGSPVSGPKSGLTRGSSTPRSPAHDARDRVEAGPGQPRVGGLDRVDLGVGHRQVDPRGDEEEAGHRVADRRRRLLGGDEREPAAGRVPAEDDPAAVGDEVPDDRRDEVDGLAGGVVRRQAVDRDVHLAPPSDGRGGPRRTTAARRSRSCTPRRGGRRRHPPRGRSARRTRAPGRRTTYTSTPCTCRAVTSQARRASRGGREGPFTEWRKAVPASRVA